MLLFSLFAVLVIWWFGDKTDETREILLVTQRSVSGLNPQAQVRYRGIRAGKVRGIELDPDNPGNILVRIGIDAKLPITRATTAQLNYQGVTGLAYVLLEDNGTNREPLQAQGQSLPRITIKQSSLESLSDRATDIVDQVSELAVRLNRMLNEKNASHLEQILVNMATASEGLKEIPQTMAALREAHQRCKHEAT